MREGARARRFLIAVLLVIPAVGGRSAFAQVPTGSIVGTVSDAQNLPIAAVAVSLTNQGTNVRYITTTTNAGVFEFTQLYAGVYRVETSKSDFRKVSVTEIKLDAGTQ